LLGSKFTGELMKEANDLVVNTESMGAIDVQIGNFVKERYDFGEIRRFITPITLHVRRSLMRCPGG